MPILTESVTTERTITLDETVGGEGVVSVVISESADSTVVGVTLIVTLTGEDPVQITISPEGWAKLEQAFRKA